MGNFMHIHSKNNKGNNNKIVNDKISKVENKNTESVTIKTIDMDTTISESNIGDEQNLINNIEINPNLNLDCQVKDIEFNQNLDINCDEKAITNDNLELSLDSENIDSPTIKEIYLRRKSISTNVVPATSLPYIYLLPHEHTLFCERKQRVCTTVGKLQELEVLKIEGFDVIPQSTVWIRISPIHYNNNNTTSTIVFDTSNNQSNKNYQIIEGTENALEYKLSREDVGYYIGCRYESNHTDAATDIHEKSFKYLIADQYGIVLSGPPRLLEFNIIGSMQVHTYAITQTNYIGGFEGPSEFWWMRINSEGRRTQITEPKRTPICEITGQATVVVIPICTPTTTHCSDSTSSLQISSLTNNNVSQLDHDPRCYKLTKDDLGCYLKAKCRPIRTDGVQGEIFTSKSSQIVIDNNEPSN